MLCVHGAKHLWCKLGWIADVAGLLASPAPPDLTRTFELAGRCGATRLLCVGLLLAKRLAGASLPKDVSARIEADLMAGSLARKVLDVVAKTPVNPDVDPARYLFYFKAKDCRLDQLLFAGQAHGNTCRRRVEPVGPARCAFAVLLPLQTVAHGRSPQRADPQGHGP